MEPTTPVDGVPRPIMFGEPTNNPMAHGIQAHMSMPRTPIKAVRRRSKPQQRDSPSPAGSPPYSVELGQMTPSANIRPVYEERNIFAYDCDDSDVENDPQRPKQYVASTVLTSPAPQLNPFGTVRTPRHNASSDEDGGAPSGGRIVPTAVFVSPGPRGRFSSVERTMPRGGTHDTPNKKLPTGSLGWELHDDFVAVGDDSDENICHTPPNSSTNAVNDRRHLSAVYSTPQHLGSFSNNDHIIVAPFATPQVKKSRGPRVVSELFPTMGEGAQQEGFLQSGSTKKPDIHHRRHRGVTPNLNPFSPCRTTIDSPTEEACHATLVHLSEQRRRMHTPHQAETLALTARSLDPDDDPYGSSPQPVGQTASSRYQWFCEISDTADACIPLHQDVNGITWLATCVQDGVPYSVKEIRGSPESAALEIKAFTLSRLTNYIVRYNTVHHHPERNVTLIQFEYYSKGSAWEYLTRHSITESEVWTILRSMLDALCVLHGNDLVHGRVNPLNMFVDNYHTFKLGGFGGVDHYSDEAAMHDVVALGAHIINILVSVVAPSCLISPATFLPNNQERCIPELKNMGFSDRLVEYLVELANPASRLTAQSAYNLLHPPHPRQVALQDVFRRQIAYYKHNIRDLEATTPTVDPFRRRASSTSTHSIPNNDSFGRHSSRGSTPVWLEGRQGSSTGGSPVAAVTSPLIGVASRGQQKSLALLTADESLRYVQYSGFPFAVRALNPYSVDGEGTSTRGAKRPGNPEERPTHRPPLTRNGTEIFGEDRLLS